MSDDKKKEMLESWIDADSLSHVLAMVADVCDEKAEHILASYDDEDTAAEWTEASESLGELVNETNV